MTVRLIKLHLESVPAVPVGDLDDGRRLGVGLVVSVSRFLFVRRQLQRTEGEIRNQRHRATPEVPELLFCWTRRVGS